MGFAKRLIALLLCAVLIIGTTLAITADEEFDVEEIEFFSEEDEETEEKEYIVRFNDSVVELYSDEGKNYALMNEDELNAAIEEGIVEHYEENGWVYLFGDVDPKQPKKWDANMLKADYAFERGYTGNGVKIAVIDSGCDITGDLTTNILEGYNLVNNSTDTKDIEEIKNKHGTIVCSQIVAEVNSVGFRGIAPNAKIVPLKIFEGTKAKTNLLIDAIYMAVDTYGCDIINMSLGTSNDSENLKEAVDYAVSKNVLVIAAAGNYKNDEDDTVDKCAYPAYYNNVISVGAVDTEKERCAYSYHNDMVDVCAPGGRPLKDGEFKEKKTKILFLLSPPNAEEKYYSNHGTSFAAPLVTGIAAIFRGINPDFTHDEFKEIIMAVSTDLGTPGYDKYYGHGLADIEKYLKYYLAPVGDNNADGLVTSTDAMEILEYVIGKIKSFVKEEMADVNKDGEINLLDAILVARAAEGWDGYDFQAEE